MGYPGVPSPLDKHCPQPHPTQGTVSGPRGAHHSVGGSSQDGCLGHPESEVEVSEQEVCWGRSRDRETGGRRQDGTGEVGCPVVSTRPHPAPRGNSNTGAPFRGIQLGQGGEGFIFTAAPSGHRCRQLPEGDRDPGGGGGRGALLPKQLIPQGRAAGPQPTSRAGHRSPRPGGPGRPSEPQPASASQCRELTAWPPCASW